MLIKILGFFDIISAIVLFLASFIDFAVPVMLIFAFCLIAKGIFFIILGGLNAGSFANFIDILAGVLFYLSISFGLPKILFVVFSLLLLQKGVFSLAY